MEVEELVSQESPETTGLNTNNSTRQSPAERAKEKIKAKRANRSGSGSSETAVRTRSSSVFVNIKSSDGLETPVRMKGEITESATDTSFNTPPRPGWRTRSRDSVNTSTPIGSPFTHSLSMLREVEEKLATRSHETEGATDADWANECREKISSLEADLIRAQEEAEAAGAERLALSEKMTGMKEAMEREISSFKAIQETNQELKRSLVENERSSNASSAAYQAKEKALECEVSNLKKKIEEFDGELISVEYEEKAKAATQIQELERSLALSEAKIEFHEKEGAEEDDLSLKTGAAVETRVEEIESKMEELVISYEDSMIKLNP